jgi:hypothetical protein
MNLERKIIMENKDVKVVEVLSKITNKFLGGVNSGLDTLCVSEVVASSDLTFLKNRGRIG